MAVVSASIMQDEGSVNSLRSVLHQKTKDKSSIKVTYPLLSYKRKVQHSLC